MTRIADLQDRLLRLARRREDDGIYTDAELVRAAERALAERAGGVNEDALRALAQAYDREDAAQRGEPDPWDLDDPGDIGDSDTWVSERLACARAAAEAFLSALEPAALSKQEAVPQLGGAPDDLRNCCAVLFEYLDIGQINEFTKKVLARRDPALTSPAPAEPSDRPSGHVEIAHDGFAGDIIGHYTTREGKRGVVVQQDGTRVVHVYGEKWLAPAPHGEGA